MTSKRITLLKRKQGLDAAAFRSHWAGPHAEIARNLPGLERYEQNHVIASSVAEDDEAWPVHGVVELWFRDQAAVAEAGRSEITQALILDEPTFMSGLTGLSVSGSVAPVEAAWKMFAFTRDSAAGADGAAALRAQLAAQPGSRGVEFAHVTSVMRRDVLWSDPSPPAYVVVAPYNTRSHATQGLDLVHRRVRQTDQDWEFYITETKQIA